MDSTVQTTNQTTEEKETYKSYDLYIHLKQGDDFRGFLNDADGNIPGALRNWAESLRGGAAHCEELANAMEDEIAGGAGIEVDADVNIINFYGDEEALDRLVEKKLLDCQVYEDE